MLSKANKLTKKREFDEVFKKGKTVKHGFLLCKVVAGRGNTSRFGLVVSKKVSKKAVARNLVRRRLGAALFRECKAIKNPVDVVVVALPESAGKSFQDIQENTHKVCLDF